MSSKRLARIASSEISKSDVERFFTEFETKAAIFSKRSAVPVVDVEAFFVDAFTRINESERFRSERDKTDATSFNIFEYIDPDENKLSDILAMLFDPNGSHGQGALFLNLFLKQLNLPDVLHANVIREAPTYGISRFNRRIDILIEAEGVKVGIENKVDSLEQNDQLKDYLQHLQYCARGQLHHLLYLTPNGRRPKPSTPELNSRIEDKKLLLWSYQKELLAWLNSCRKVCKAPRVSQFLNDFIQYIETTLKRETEAMESVEDE